MFHPEISGARRVALVSALLLILILPAARSVRGATLEITGREGVEVRLDGVNLGRLPLDGPVTVGRGLHEIVGSLPGHSDHRETFMVPEETTWLHVRLRPIALRRKHAVTSNILLAGLGQRYMGANFRGWVYTAAEVGGLALALVAEIRRSDLEKDYQVYKDEYDRAINPDDIAFYKDKSATAYSDMRDAADVRNTSLLVAVGAIGVSMLDALLFFPGVDMGPGPVPPSPTANLAPAGIDLAAVHVGVKLKF